MSQPASPRTQVSTAGMVGAMVVVVLLALGWVGFRQLTSDDEATPVQTVDWAPWVKAGRTDQQLLVFAPPTLPAGWRATSVEYTPGNGAYWHLGLLTDTGKYVGIDESRSSVEDMVQQYVDADAVRGKDVTVAGQKWQTWTDSGGDYALARSVEFGGAPYESVLIGGSAADASIREFVASLRSGRVNFAG
jgi:hypothetical protein